MTTMHKHSRTLLLLTVAVVASAALAGQVWADAHEDKPADVACQPKVRADLLTKVKPTDAAIEAGQKAYKTNCAICHGDKGLGDGIGGTALDPKPRNFAAEKLVKTSSPLGLFDSITNGLEGTAMASFSHLPEADRWGIVHYIRRDFIPEDKRVDPTDDQIEAICIELSAPPKNPEIPVEIAMAILVEENQANWATAPNYGPVKLSKEIASADAKVGADVLELGKAVYGANCGRCHGADGSGVKNLERYGRYPFVDISTRPLSKNHAGGTWEDFADRGAMGAHRTLPDMSAAAMMNVDQWRALQAWVAQLAAGDAVVTTDRPKAPSTALLYVGEAYELHMVGGRVLKIEGDAQTPVASWSDLRDLLISANLPETQGNGALVKGWIGQGCTGKTCKGVALPAPTEFLLKFTAPTADPTEAPE